MAGLNGLMQGIMQGMPYGIDLGDRIAAMRSNNRMQDVQDQIDSGQFAPANFNGDSAAAQQALQTAVRNAQAPLSSRGQDQSYGDQQYQRLLGLQQLRGDQQAGAQMNTGDIAGGAAMAGNTSAALGNLGQGLQRKQLSGQMQAGANAITTTDPNGQPLSQPDVDQSKLAQGMATNAAQFGDASSSAQWGEQQQNQRQAIVNSNLGRGLQIATNQSLGGMAAAAGYFDAAAKGMGYPGVQLTKDGTMMQVTGHDGQAAAIIYNDAGMPAAQQQQIEQQYPGAVGVTKFAQTVGNDPSKIMANINAMQAQTYQQTVQTNQERQKSIFDARLKAAGTYDPNAGVQLEKASKASTAAVDGAGYALGQPDPNAKETDKDGNVITGVSYLLTPKNGGTPYQVFAPSDRQPGQPAFVVRDQAGHLVDPNELPAKDAQSRTSMMSALGDQAVAMNAALNSQAQGAMQRGFTNIAQQYGVERAPQPQGQQSADTGGQTQGALPQVTTQALQSAQQLYKSPYSDLDMSHMMTESSGNPQAVSPTNVHGLMQVTQGTMGDIESQLGWPKGIMAQNPAYNIAGGQWYRDQLINGWKQAGVPAQSAIALGLASYFRGPSAVAQLTNNGQNPAALRNDPEALQYALKTMAGAGMFGAKQTATKQAPAKQVPFHERLAAKYAMDAAAANAKLPKLSSPTIKDTFAAKNNL